MLTLLINQENANFYFVSPYRLTLKKKTDPRASSIRASKGEKRGGLQTYSWGCTLSELFRR